MSNASDARIYAEYLRVLIEQPAFADSVSHAEQLIILMIAGAPRGSEVEQQAEELASELRAWFANDSPEKLEVRRAELIEKVTALRRALR